MTGRFAAVQAIVGSMAMQTSFQGSVSAITGYGVASTIATAAASRNGTLRRTHLFAAAAVSRIA